MKALGKQIKAMSKHSLSNHLGVTTETVRNWIKKDSIPSRHRRGIVERLEGINDDNLLLCDKILKSKEDKSLKS